MMNIFHQQKMEIIRQYEIISIILIQNEVQAKRCISFCGLRMVYERRKDNGKNFIIYKEIQW